MFVIIRIIAPLTVDFSPLNRRLVDFLSQLLYTILKGGDEMDQIKTGKLIAERRKAQHLTQRQLAESLGITDRAVSKWENGKSLPDSGIMLDLCAILEISVNELLSGEVLEMKEYNEKAEQNLIEMKKQKEQADREMLRLEYVIGFTGSVSFMMMVFVASFVPMQNWVRILLIAAGMVIFMVAMFFGLRIEQRAGYYECAKCGHRYVPKYSSVFFAMHINRTRYMKCPHCGKRSWQKKVISKEH